MRAGLTCHEAQALIAGYRGAWLSRTQAAHLEAHLQSCAACAREMGRDALLCEALSVMPGEAPAPPVMPAWSAAARPPARRRVPSLALATAAVAGVLGLMLMTHHTVSPPDTHHPAAPVIGRTPATDAGTWRDAHDFVSLSDASADPNRVMVLLYASHEHGVRQ